MLLQEFFYVFLYIFHYDVIYCNSLHDSNILFSICSDLYILSPEEANCMAKYVEQENTAVHLLHMVIV